MVGYGGDAMSRALSRLQPAHHPQRQSDVSRRAFITTTLAGVAAVAVTGRCGLAQAAPQRIDVRHHLSPGR
jgi:hypothetical protein